MHLGPDISLEMLPACFFCDSTYLHIMLSLIAVAGVLEFGQYTIVDINGNNNGKLDPGETADLIISVENSGGAGATGVIGQLTTNDTYITITQSQITYGDIAAGDEAEATFEVSADESTPTGHPASFNFDITADKDLTGQGSFIIIIGQVPVLIIDMDENHNSADKIADALDEIGVTYEEAMSIPDDLDIYSSVFVCLGIYSDNHVLTNSEGQQLADYLNAGGDLYMEGGDTWYYDSPTPVHAMFGINGVEDGSSDLSTIEGVTGTFTEGMSFNYNGDNNWIDHLEATGTGFLILNNTNPPYGTAVANDAGTYMTIGASHEFGGLDDSRVELMEAYLEFFGLMPSTLVPNFSADVTGGCTGLEVHFTDESLGATSWSWTFPGGTPATSTEQNPTVVYDTTGSWDVTLIITNNLNSDTITMEDYINVFASPDVTLDTFEVACIYWEPYALTGGLPEGGVYSGDGVTNISASLCYAVQILWNL